MTTILRWTSPARAKKQIKRGRKVLTAAQFNREIRDREYPNWVGHIGMTNEFTPSCGCPSCTAARFNMKV